MQQSNLPAQKFSIPWANGAGGGFIRTIPTASQIGITNGAASLTDGFPPLNFVPIGSGGVPPFGQDFNGIFQEITAWNRWQQAGGVVPYDATFQGLIGGYPKGALIASGTTANLLWMSTTDNNVTDPDTGGSGWIPCNFTLDSGSSGNIVRDTSPSFAGTVTMPDGSLWTASGVTTGSAGNQVALEQWGSWTPTFNDAGGARTFTYSTQAGYYYVRGAFVLLNCNLAATAIGGSGSGFVVINGCPFSTVTSPAASGAVAWSMEDTRCIGFSGSYTNVNWRWLSNGAATQFTLDQIGNAVAPTSVTSNALTISGSNPLSASIMATFRRF